VKRLELNKKQEIHNYTFRIVQRNICWPILKNSIANLINGKMEMQVNMQ
jgi:hypothetical protein